MDFYGYFYTYYLHLHRGCVYIVTNYMVAALIPLLLRSRKKPNQRGTVLKVLLSCVIIELFAVGEYTLLGRTDDVPTIGGGLLLVLFTLFDQELPPVERTGLAYAFAGSYVNIVALITSIGIINENTYVLQAILILLTLVLLPAVVIMFRKIAETPLEEKEFLIPIAISGSIGFVFGCGGYWLKINTVMKLPLYILMVMLQITVYAVSFYVNSWFQKRQTTQVKQVLRSADEAMLAALKSDLEVYSKLRHDMNNHYVLMKNLLEQKAYDKLQEYFSKFSDLMIPPRGVVDCGNKTVTVILNMEQEKAKRSGVELDIRVAVPTEMGFADTDLCSLLTNLIDNAIEYLSKHPELPEKAAAVDMRMTHGNLFLTVKNPILSQDQECALALRTTKEDKRFHGLGTKLVASVVSHYNGVIHYGVEDDHFIVDVMLIEPAEGEKIVCRS